MKRGIFSIAGGLVPLLLASPALADHPVVGGGVSSGAPVVTIAADTLPQGALTGGLQISYLEPDSYSDEELIALASQHVDAHTTDYNALVTASLSYGVTSHFTVSASLPYLRRDDLRAGEHSHSGEMVANSIEALGTVTGIGDATIIGQYQFVHSHAQGWSLAVLGGLKLPTGATHRLSDEGERLEAEHQPGTGSWDPLLGLAGSRHWGPVSLDANVLYQFSTLGAQETELGDRLSFNTAISYSLGQGNHDHADRDGEHGHGSWSLVLELNGEWEGRQRISGEIEGDSGGTVIYLSPGVRFGAAHGWTAALSVGVPVWQDIRPSHPDNSMRIIAQIGSRF
jgi:hypothetical protein